MVVWRGVQGGCGVFFKSAIELIQIIYLLLILHSAGGWYLFSLDENWILNLSK